MMRRSAAHCPLFNWCCTVVERPGALLRCGVAVVVIPTLAAIWRSFSLGNQSPRLRKCRASIRWLSRSPRGRDHGAISWPRPGLPATGPVMRRPVI
jgi:hypothetical protein